MGGVVSGIGDALGSVARGVGDVLGSVGSFAKKEAPILGGIAGGLIGGPWGAAAGSALGEAVKGGNLKQDLIAGAMGGLGSLGASQLGLGGGGGDLGSGTADTLGALGSQGATDYLGAGIGELYGQVPASLAGGAAGSAGGSLLGGGIGDVLGAFNAAGAAGASGLGGASAADAAGTNWWQSLGGGGTSASPGAGSTVLGAGQAVGAAGAGGAGGSSTLGNIGSGLLQWAGKNPATALQLGMAAYGATQKPQLPAALKSLNATSLANIQSAQGVINSGGTSSPNWASQKASIDSSIDEQVKQATQALLQRAANSGLDPNSMVVQQQIAQLNQQATTQKQGLYQQAQQQNVSEAMSLLSGGSQALASIGQAQMQEDQQAQQLIAQLAGGALNTYAKQGQSVATAGAGG